MQVTDQTFFAEVIPTNPRNPLQAGAHAHNRRDTRRSDEEGSAMSFSHLLGEQQKRPEPGTGSRGKTEAKDETSPKAAADTIEGNNGVETRRNAPATSVAGVQKPSMSATDDGNQPAVVDMAENSVSLSATSTGAPGAAVDGVTVATSALGIQVSAAAIAVSAKQVATQLTDGSQAQATPQATTAPDPGSVGQPTVAPAGGSGMPTAAGSIALAATNLADTTTDSAAPQAVAQPSAGQGTPTPAPAVVPGTVAQGQAAYAQPPVVSEAQLVAESLKQGRNAKSPAPASAGSGSQAEAEGLQKVLSGLKQAALTDANPGHQQATADKKSAMAAELETKPATVTAGDTSSSQETITDPDVSKQAAAAPAKVKTQPTDAQTPAETVAALTAESAAEGKSVNSEKVSTGADTPAATTRRIHGQVVTHLNRHLGQVVGHEKVTIKLNPESLGQIELNFEGREDRLSVVITATTSEANAALHENLKDLTERIVDRSSRFSHVEVRVELRDGAATRPDGKPDQKQEGRQDQRRQQDEQRGQNDQREQNEHGGQQARRARQAWESAMSWDLTGENPTEEG